MYVPNVKTLDAISDEYRGKAKVTLANNGDVITIKMVGTRFSVFLDDEKYPVNSMILEPGCPLMYVSNYSFRGPDLYPIGYEAAQVGTCVLRNGDFSVTIIVVEK